jgi:hypothetical protein
MDTGPVLALEPLSTILPGNYRHLQRPQVLDRLTLFLGDCFQEHIVPTEEEIPGYLALAHE